MMHAPFQDWTALATIEQCEVEIRLMKLRKKNENVTIARGQEYKRKLMEFGRPIWGRGGQNSSTRSHDPSKISENSTPFGDSTVVFQWKN